MTSRYLNALSEATNTIKHQRWAIGGLTIVALAALVGWRTRDDNLTVHIPPDLSAGAIMKIGRRPDVPAPNVYLFGFHVWQQLNNWSKDGAKDYGQQIFDYQWYITPSCRQQIETDMRLKADASELVGRTRTIMEIPGQGYTDDRVTRLGSGAWRVRLDVSIEETVKGVSVKKTYVRYPLRVVRYDVNRERNAWGLAVDCFGNDRPERLDVSSLKTSPQIPTSQPQGSQK